MVTAHGAVEEEVELGALLGWIAPIVGWASILLVD